MTPSWIVVIQWIGRIVLLLLAGLSIWSVAIMLDRNRRIREERGKGDFDELKRWIGAGQRPELERWTNSASGLRAGTLKAVMEANPSSPALMDRSVRGYLTEERNRMETGLTVLATLGSNAPFIGLFGTVLGIIQAFGELAAQKQGNQAVMSGISEALVATAVGLFVAIPAVVAYNSLSKQIRNLFIECEVLRDLYIARFAGTEKS